MALSGALQRVIDWLRAGYPEGVPPQDYFPLLALLSTHLSEDEVRDTIKAVPALSEGEDQEATHEIITTVHSTPPSADEISRVLAHLQSVGWDFDAAGVPPAPHENGSSPA
jgi:S-formylglutathione hydrolase FrmB